MFSDKLFSRKVLSVVLCLATVFVTGFCSYKIDSRLTALRVKYSGKVIATIKEKAEFDDAVEIVSRTVCGSNVSDALEEPTYTEVLVTEDQLNNTADVAQAIIENTDEIAQAYAVTVNGEVFACMTEPEIYNLLDEARCRFEQGENCVSSFTDTVEVSCGYYLADQILSAEDTRAALETLSVETSFTAVSEQDIPFNTVKEKSDELLMGKTQTKVAGKKGKKTVSEQVVLQNGKEISREQIAASVTEEATDAVVLVGTKRPTGTVRVNTGFVFPLPKGVWTVSAYYGDGRGHRAVDLACHAGTPIFSAASGTVEWAGWEQGGYGYSVVINHGNGLKTRYAHASALYVSKGQQVSAGQNIAAVGKTGYATGNHLHFEVLINGNRVNPAPYIGL
ncbi:MAG: peptidoglycan DD-metalloendopeptidase family protein [Clostridia bacterium]|nr:peptidoglycan DD-metalloendopeptidase family protein [Clostridia bacterium]